MSSNTIIAKVVPKKSPIVLRFQGPLNPQNLINLNDVSINLESVGSSGASLLFYDANTKLFSLTSTIDAGTF